MEIRCRRENRRVFKPMGRSGSATGIELTETL
jgi:hypothetical protein